MCAFSNNAALGPLLGVDVGGTFTDAVLIVAGSVHTAKVLSTDPQSDGVLTAIEAVLGAAELAPTAVERFVHGMTVATNALLERRGARVALVTTEGFRDILAIARQDRSVLYTLYPQRSAPLVPRERVVTARERVGPDGVECALTLEEARQVAREVRRLQPEAVAVCLLWSFLHPEHEQMLGSELRRALPGVPVVTSVELAPVFREYERMSTTVIDAYVTPRTAAYLRDVASKCGAAGLRQPEIMQSSGGTTDVEAATGHAARLLLSGPAGGAVAARLLGARHGFDRVLSFDMGGTSTDCAALAGQPDRPASAAPDGAGVPESQHGGFGTTSERVLAGLPVRLPMVDVHTVSAGGGSIAWSDEGGALKVGPRSAGARPGPACYGLGGVEPTVTDALVVLGRIPPDAALAGALLPDRGSAAAAVGRIAAALGLTVEQAAAGIVQVATANMAAALRAVTLERGLDPREFLLVAFGGAGGLHACDLADELGIDVVLLPARAGVLSALGLCVAPRRADRTFSLLRPVTTLTRAEWDERWNELEAQVSASYSIGSAPRPGAGDSRAEPVPLRREVEARYRGQSHELSVLLERDEGPESVVSRFHLTHDRWYGYTDVTAEVEIVALRAVAEMPAGPQLAGEPAPVVELMGMTPVYRDGDTDLCPVWRVSSHAAAAAGSSNGETSSVDADPPVAVAPTIAGPALVVSTEFCGIVASGWMAEPVSDGFLLSRVARSPVSRRAV